MRSNNLSSRSSSSTKKEKNHSIRDEIKLNGKKFNIQQLPDDILRVYQQLEQKYNEEYALLFVFTMRTACELHRAWHMTLLTSKILQQVKDKFGLRLTWDLGVFKLKFLIEDGWFELHRKVPYDYDSEYQDIYMRIAVALIDGHINVHEALNYQEETLRGEHTATSGIFLRDFPGRLILYPIEAATCAVIFFRGDWEDAGIAAICGLASGIVEMILTYLGGEFKILVDVAVGFVTGIIGGLFYWYSSGGFCLPSIFLGTLYWFFYGTAFVIGILEIIAGELETGVTRFIAVSVKTFVLSLGAALGLMVATSKDATSTWFESEESYCGLLDLNVYWWRIPLYLLCSASVLGQYRFPIVQYWRGLIVQLCAYEIQYQSFAYFEMSHTRDNLDTSSSNILGAAAAVVSACCLSYLVTEIKAFYTARLLQKDDTKNTKLGDLFFGLLVFCVKGAKYLHIGRITDYEKLQFKVKLQNERKELHDPTHQRQEIILLEKEEKLLLETIVGAQDVNIWSILMPALYQLVPGSIIAKLWFNSIFPPDSEEGATDTVFSNLMVISTSLALGLIVGFMIVQVFYSVIGRLLNFGTAKTSEQQELALGRLAGMYSVPVTEEDDPPQTTSATATGNSDNDQTMAEKVNAEVESYFPVVLDGDVPTGYEHADEEGEGNLRMNIHPLSPTSKPTSAVGGIPVVTVTNMDVKST